MKSIGGMAALIVVVAGCAWRAAPMRVIALQPPAVAGTADDTDWLQDELDRSGMLTLPRLPGGRCYRVRGLWITRSDTSLVSDGACLEALGPGPVRRSSGDGDPVPASAVLYVSRSRTRPELPSRILLRGLRLVVPAGLGLHGISILGHDVRVERVRVTGLPVDAVHIGGRAAGEYAEDVVIARSRLDSATRNGVSVAGVVGLRLEGNVIAGARRDPGAGVDLEPDNPDDPILDVAILGNTIRGNARAGVLVALETRSGLPLRADRIRIEGNRIVRNGGSGIELVGGQRDGRGRITIAANTIERNNGPRVGGRGRTTLLLEG